MIKEEKEQLYIDEIPIATKINLKNGDSYSIVVKDGELFLPQVISYINHNQELKFCSYYLKISKENIKELLDYYKRISDDN